MTVATMLETKSLSSPDEVRPFTDKGQAQVFTLSGRTVILGTFMPGWRWSENVKPIAKTDTCQAGHLGLCLSGKMRVQMDDGSEALMQEGDLVSIPPGHDAWVEGDAPCAFVDFGEIDEYAKPHEH